MVYEYSWSGPERAVSAEKVAKHIEHLEKQFGEVTSKTFLDSARDEDSEMHSLFEWDDTKAAEHWRMQQASVIIASIRVNVVEEEREPIRTRAYVQHEPRQSGYISVGKALSEEDKRNKVIMQARKEASWFIEKYKAFEELAEVIEAMNGFLQRTA